MTIYLILLAAMAIAFVPLIVALILERRESDEENR